MPNNFFFSVIVENKKNNIKNIKKISEINGPIKRNKGNMDTPYPKVKTGKILLKFILK